MKRQIITILLALVVMMGLAQDRLIRVDSTSVAWRKEYPQVVFNDREKARLLMSEHAEFGVECVPSFSPEWMLTYDSVAHALVYKEAQESIWKATYHAMYKLKRKSRHHSKWVKRKQPKNYEAPDVKTYTIAVAPDYAEMLRTIWTSAVGTAEEREVHILDGTKWEYFINDKRAKSHSEGNKFVQFANGLKEAVRENDACRSDSLISAECQRVVSCLEGVPAVSEE